MNQLLERLRKDLAQTWNVAPFRVEVSYIDGHMLIEVDGQPITQEQRVAFEDRARTVAAQKRSRLN